MRKLKITAGGYEFTAKLEEELAPKTCEIFKTLLPLENKLIHVRWSGQGMWIPYGETRLGLDYENNTSHPAKGEFLLYPCLLYTSDAADEEDSVDLGGRRIIKKQTKQTVINQGLIC